MPLQNRVDPFGEIHAVAARGMFTGNRGVIHDPETRSLLGRRWTTKAWIVCDCGFKGRKRDVMGRNAPSGGAGWTNLFFLDEPTALAAGHRPCFYCRREAAGSFAEAFSRAFRTPWPGVRHVDARLHAERLSPISDRPGLSELELAALPDGAMVAIKGRAFALRRGRLLAWGFDGYRSAEPFAHSRTTQARLLIPKTIVDTLKAGYRPQWHSSARP